MMLICAMVASRESAFETAYGFKEHGFEEPLQIFADSITARTTVGLPRAFCAEYHAAQLGNSYNNHVRALHWCANRAEEADYVLIFEDDVRFCRSSRRKLEQALRDYPDGDVFSLYTVHKDSWVGLPEGWFKHNDGKGAVGAQAICYRGPVAKELAGDLKQSQWRPHVDVTVFKWCEDRGKAVYYHCPSLVQHVGRKSNIAPDQMFHQGLRFSAEY